MKQACLYLYQKMGKSHHEIMAFMKVSKRDVQLTAVLDQSHHRNKSPNQV